jgi:hypothetical protein
MLLPIQIPTAIEEQGLQGGQSITVLLTPVPALMLLTSCHKQVIAFFNMGAANVVRSLLSIDWDKSSAGMALPDQLLEFLDVLGLWAIFFQNVQSILHLAMPKVFE